MSLRCLILTYVALVASGALLAGVTLLASELLWLLEVLELKFVPIGNLDRQHDVEQNRDQKNNNNNTEK